MRLFFSSETAIFLWISYCADDFSNSPLTPRRCPGLDYAVLSGRFNFIKNVRHRLKTNLSLGAVHRLKPDILWLFIFVTFKDYVGRFYLNRVVFHAGCTVIAIGIINVMSVIHETINFAPVMLKKIINLVGLVVVCRKLRKGPLYATWKKSDAQ